MRPSAFPGKTTTCLQLVVPRTASLDFSGKRRPTRPNRKPPYTTISVWAGRCLEYLVLPLCNLENSRLAQVPPDETGLEQATGSSLIYRNAIGPYQGQKACSLQTLLQEGGVEEPGARVTSASGFSLSAGVVTTRHARQKLERGTATASFALLFGDSMIWVDATRVSVKPGSRSKSI